MAWCDAMGTGRCLAQSLHQAANSVFKLHSAFSIAQIVEPTIRCYPVMDGVYVTSSSRTVMNHALRVVFSELAREFIGKHGTSHMHMIRCGLAFGPTLHGAEVPEEAFYGEFSDGRVITRDEFESSWLKVHRQQVLLSPAMVHAYNAESSAPPFGIYVDDSAKSSPVLADSSDTGYITSLYQWWSGNDEATEIATHLYGQIVFYLAKAKIHSVGMSYPVDSIVRHEKLTAEYFGGLSLDKE